MNENIPKIIKDYINSPYPLLLNCKIMSSDEGYHWGDKKFIPKLLNFKNKEKKSYAEIWIGAHKKAPSNAIINNTQVNLYDLINTAGKEILGINTFKKFGNNLPFLFKLLSSAQPLSIQAHPNKKQAEDGWKREKGKGPNYKDANHKPELISAVTDFWVLNGFRNINDIIKQFKKLNIKYFSPAISKLKKDFNSDETVALKNFYNSISNISLKEKSIIINKILLKAKIKYFLYTILFFFFKRFSKQFREYWIIKVTKSLKEIIEKDYLKRKISLKEKYEKNIEALYGIISIYLLNLIHLKPGQAMFLSAGELHSYLEGTGMEIMANSDNVLRGGLTHKYIDINELLNILTFKPKIPEILGPIKISEIESYYKTPAIEFKLSLIDLDNKKLYINKNNNNAEAFIVLKGSAEIIDVKKKSLFVSKGDTFFIPSIVKKYSIKPKSNYVKIYKASIP
jgi:mannose-6-phosphate isomerase class I